jgi:hypothetical protein
LNIGQRLRLLNPLRGIYEQQGSIASERTFVTPRTKNQHGKASSHGVNDVKKREERLQRIRKTTQIWEFEIPEKVLAKVEIVNLPVFLHWYNTNAVTTRRICFFDSRQPDCYKHHHTTTFSKYNNNGCNK